MRSEHLKLMNSSVKKKKKNYIYLYCSLTLSGVQLDMEVMFYVLNDQIGSILHMTLGPCPTDGLMFDSHFILKISLTLHHNIILEMAFCF